MAEWLDNDVLSYDAWRKHRILLIEIFDFALGKGLLPANYGNPAKVLLNRIKPPKARQRLKLEEYQAIYDKAPDWLQIAMDISLQTTLRLGDVLNLKFEDIIEKDLLVTPSKTSEVPNPIHLKIEIRANLAGIISRARQTDIVSPFIVHRRPKANHPRFRDKKEHWTQINPNYASGEFAKARDATGMFQAYKKGEAPTFHEIRALSSFMYKAAGREQDSVQALMGHSSEVMTKLYQSGHDIEYVETWADLNIP